MSHNSISPAQYAQQHKTQQPTNPVDDTAIAPREATLDDLFRVADALGVSAADLMRFGSRGDACGCPDYRCAGYHHDADLDHCPCADSLAQDGPR